MSVMSCCRTDCPNIMCDIHSREFGYICYECKRELEGLKPQNIGDVKEFMNSRKGIDYTTDGVFDLDNVFQ